MAEFSLENVVDRAEDLPALPQVVNRVLDLINNPDSSLESISELISRDPVLTFRMLKLANSAYYGFARKVSTVHEALVLLGLSITKNLVLAVSVFNIMNKEISGYVLGKGDLWKHSIVTAVMARILAGKTGCCDPEKAFTAGLMHDIGKIVMNTYMVPQFDNVVETVREEHLPFMVAERSVLGFNHAQVGGGIARRWNLPEELVEAIGYHHEPALAKTNPQLASVVHIADIACMSMGIGLGGDGLLYPIEPRALEILEVTPEHIEELIAEAVDYIRDNEAMLKPVSS